MNVLDLLHTYFPFGFPASRDGWERFDVVRLLARDEPFSPENARYTVRRLADVYNQRPAPTGSTRPPVRAEQFLALGILTDALRYVCLHFGLRQKPGILNDGFQWTRERLGPDVVDGLPPVFAALFPPRDVSLGRQAPDAWLAAGDPPLAASERIVIESVLLYLMMRNPATRPLREVFDDADLQRQASYVPFVVSLEAFLDHQEPSSLTGQTLFHTLRAPILACPDDLEGQLAFIRAHWAHILPDELLARLQLAVDLLREMDLHRAPQYGPPPVLSFARSDDATGPEAAAFSRDADWMSNVVLIAKSTYVWLDQLSKRHGRPVTSLADVPDEELDRLAAWGFTGLWLIGLWERSRASARIKQYMGNPDAVASAYSLADYRIADDLGGDAAYANLRERAWRRGIRLASDMVPNHMGIDSRWVIEHPDWFLQTDRPPYPGYRFTGGDLCDDGRAEIRVEEGYWTHSDAAVVFERRDPHTGATRYIYHGNDGTSMPWNDTAQLDFTRPDVREAVIQTILHVARRFPIIRFDAAMTLARKHYQRLWFPAPGDSGAIPSRAEYGMTRDAFLNLMPVEFWREVVDRVAQEVPDTLLLAEAFWLMEGYFVRTLGMHRVYNSAFMNMLKMEENAKYRQTVRNVLEFSPEVLKRFVNFMNNPDERTAVEQFGKGDKYFGAAVLMVTMPGLPMFGHGQIEGFAEKYGMEYRRAYWDEPIDEDMIRRHEREVFPLMRRRALFSGVENFLLFDFVRGDASVDENVFTYCNRHGHERAVVFYNNAYESTTGQIHTSTPINVADQNHEPHLVRRSLAEALALDGSPGVYYAIADPIGGQEYLRSGEELVRDGLRASLRGYQCQVLLDFAEIRDQDGSWTQLHQRLAGAPTPSLARTRRELELSEVLAQLVRVNAPAVVERLREATAPDLAAVARVLQDLVEAARAAGSRPTSEPAAPAGPQVEDVQAALAAQTRPVAAPPDDITKALVLTAATVADSLVLGYLAWQVRWLADVLAPPSDHARLTDLDLELLAGRLREPLTTVLTDGPLAHDAIWLADLLAHHATVLDDRAGAASRLFADPRTRRYLACHHYDGATYFNRERFESLVRHLLLQGLRSASDGDHPRARVAIALQREAEAGGYREDHLVRAFAPRTETRVAPTPRAAGTEDTSGQDS